MVHARGKLTTGSGTLEEVPQIGQFITMNDREHKVLAVQTTKPKGSKILRRPIIDIELLNRQRQRSFASDLETTPPKT